MVLDIGITALGALTFLSITGLLVLVTFTKPTPRLTRLAWVCGVTAIVCFAGWFAASGLVIAGVLS